MHRAFLAFLLAASIVPVLVVDTLPLHDFPGHYARLRILAAYDHDPAFASHYERLSFLLPNIAFDAVVLALSSVMTVKTASQLFVAAAVLMCGIGVACLQRALFGELSLSVIAGVMLALNGILLWGFVNYLFGVGLMLLAFAAWVASRSRMLQLATGTAASLLLLFSHLVAFGLYALLVFGWEVEGLLRRRWPFARVAASGLQFVPATLLFLTMRTASEDPLAFRWVNHPAEKLEFIVRSLTTLVPPADLALGLAALVILAMAARRRLRLALDPRMRLPLSIVGLAFVALPFSMFGSHFLDARIPIAFFLLLAGSARLTAADSGARRAAEATLAGACLIRVATIVAAWSGYDAAFRALDFKGVGQGDVVFTAAAPRRGLADRLADWQPPMTFAAAYAAPSGAFVPSVFADPRHQPLAVRRELAHLQRLQTLLPIAVADAQALQRVALELRAASPFQRTFLFLLRCRNLPLGDDPAYTVVSVHDRACLLRLGERGPPGQDAQAPANVGSAAAGQGGGTLERGAGLWQLAAAPARGDAAVAQW